MTDWTDMNKPSAQLSTTDLSTSFDSHVVENKERSVRLKNAFFSLSRWWVGVLFMVILSIGLGVGQNQGPWWVWVIASFCLSGMCVMWWRSSLLEVRLHEEQSAKRLTMLRELEKALLSGCEQKDVAQIALGLLKEVVPMSGGAVVAFQYEENRACLLACEEHTSERDFTEVTYPLSIIKCLPQLAKGQIVEAPQMNLERLSDEQIEHFKYRNVDAALFLPLCIEDELWGMICLEFQQPRLYHTEHIQIAADVANTVALSFHQASILRTLRTERHTLSERVFKSNSELSEVHAELTRAERTRKDFVANMSHELLTPLNAILGMSELMSDGVFGDVSERQSYALSTISSSGDKLLHVIRDVLSLAKVESGHIELDVLPISLNDLCDSVVARVAKAADEKSIQVHLEMNACWEAVEADANYISKALSKLLQNAVKFTESGKSVGLKVESCFEKEVVYFSIWDEGQGIPQEDVRQLFEPFMQMDAGLNRGHEGVGLGLALVIRFIDLHGGSVSVFSTPGEGTSISVALPLRSPQNQLREFSACQGCIWDDSCPVESCTGHLNSGPQGALIPLQARDFNCPSWRGVVLVAEDNGTVLRTWSWALARLGFTVVEARNGEEVILQAQEYQPCLFLIDLQLPILSGLDAIRQLRDPSLPFSTTAPILAFSALITPEEEGICLAEGCDAYFPKPVPFHLLDRILEPYISKSISTPSFTHLRV